MSNAEKPASIIPIIDVGAIFGRDAGAIQSLVDEIAKACRSIGFFYIVNHGIEADLYERAFAASRSLFQLPLADKIALDITKSPHMRGYFGFGGDKSDGVHDDIKEGFDMAMDLPLDDPYVKEGLTFYGPNVWPPSLPQFKEVMTEYHRRHLHVGRALLRLFARGLGVHDEFFDNKFVKPMAQFRTLRYPPSHNPRAPEIGAGEHTDFGWITMIAQDDAGGLEIQDRHGIWGQVPYVPGSLVVNVGDLMSMWTNDTYTATMHRVINRGIRDRYSIAFFMDPDYHVVVECLDSCISQGRPAKYPPIVVGDYMNRRFYETTAFRPGHEAACEAASNA